jgi:hypothetical protein
MLTALIAVGAVLMYWMSVRAAYRYLITKEPWQAMTYDGFYNEIRDEKRTQTSYKLACFAGPFIFAPAAGIFIGHTVMRSVTWKQPPTVAEKKEKEKADTMRRAQLKADIENAEIELAAVTTELEDKEWMIKERLRKSLS